MNPHPEAQEPHVTKLVLESYLAMIKNSIDAHVWQNYYAEVDGERLDVMYGGKNACAWFASGILVMHRLIKHSHATVASTVKDLEESGWVTISQPRPGAVLVYEPLTFEDGSSHEHIAFFIGDNAAISTSYAYAVPIQHDWLYREKSERAVQAIYWLAALEKPATT